MPIAEENQTQLDESPERDRELDDNESMSSAEAAREKDGPFISMLKDNTRQLVDNGRLDEVGYEPPGIASGWADSLDLMNVQQKMEHDKQPLIGLIERVRDIAYYLPIIKDISRKQLENDLTIQRIWDKQDCYLQEVSVQVMWQELKEEVYDRLEHRNK